VIVPIVNAENKDSVMVVVNDLKEKLIADSIIGNHGVNIDDRDLRPGDKYFWHEKRGVPIRIEIGPKDIANNQCVLVRRDTGEKINTELINVIETINLLLNTMQSDLLKKAENNLKEKTKEVSNWDDFVKEIENNNFVMAHYDGSPETEKLIKDITGATVRCIPFNENPSDGICIKTGNQSKQRVLFARAY
jgi:prolyl-tRNA synthetase